MSNIKELNKHLFSQLERLDNPHLSDEQLKQEVERTQAVTSIAKQVIDAGTLVVQAEKVRQEYRGPMGHNNILEGIK